MSKIVNLNDSDCEIEQQHISCIILDDSHEEGEDIEDGELNNDEDDNFPENTICEIKFTKTNHEKFGAIITELLKDKLNEQNDDERNINVVPADKGDYVILNVKYDNESTRTASKSGSDKINGKPQEFEKELSPDLTGISELFTIDTSAAVKLDTVNVPSYKRAIKDVLLDEEAAAHKKQKQEQKNMKVSKVSTCFNCGEPDHSIRDCPMPHNARRVQMAKKKFTKTERYHVDVEQRFAHLRPGVVSDKLREAMGLRKGELPFFFYNMRVLGYPPGWLEDAKVEHSGITLFNSDGSKVLHSDEDDGEVETSSHKYNVSKIIDFPGFNQDPGENFYDDYDHHNVPPFDKSQLKEEFVKTMGDNVVKGYKRKKLKDFPNANADDSANNSFQAQVSDMEIEDAETTNTNIEFVRPPPPTEPNDEEAPPPPPLPPSTPKAVQSLMSSLPGSPQSPTLAELERKKKILLQELNTSVIEIEDSLVDEIMALDSSMENDESKSPKTVRPDNKSNIQDADTQGSTENSKDSCKSSDSISHDIEESFVGTPVLKFSPYDALPNGENFKVGVSDVINFENLPDSTGKYENMKELIKKVRTVIHKLHSDE